MTDTPDEKTLVIDIKKMKFKHFKTLLSLSAGKKGGENTMTGEDVAKVIDVLDLVVVGGIDELDVIDMGTILGAITDAIAAANNPN